MIIVTIIKVETVVNIVIYLIISKVTKLETLRCSGGRIISGSRNANS